MQAERKAPDFINCEKDSLTVGYLVSGRLFMARLIMDSEQRFMIRASSTEDMIYCYEEECFTGVVLLVCFIRFFYEKESKFNVLHSKNRMEDYFSALWQMYNLYPLHYFEYCGIPLDSVSWKKQFAHWHRNKFFFSSCDMHTTRFISGRLADACQNCKDTFVYKVTAVLHSFEWCVFLYDDSNSDTRRDHFGIRNVCNANGDMIFFPSENCVSISCHAREGFFYDMSRGNPQSCWDFVLDILSDGDSACTNVRVLLPRLLDIMTRMDDDRFKLVSNGGFSAARLFEDDSALTLLDTFSIAYPNGFSDAPTVTLKATLERINRCIQEGKVNLSSNVKRLLHKTRAELQVTLKTRRKDVQRERKEVHEQELAQKEQQAITQKINYAEERIQSCMQVVGKCLEEGKLEEALQRLYVAKSKYLSDVSPETSKEFECIYLAAKNKKTQKNDKGTGTGRKGGNKGKDKMMLPGDEKERTQKKEFEEFSDLALSFAGMSCEPSSLKEEQNECIVCMEETRSHAGTSCGHLILCGACSQKASSCPVCLKETKWIKIFF